MFRGALSGSLWWSRLAPLPQYSLYPKQSRRRWSSARHDPRQGFLDTRSRRQATREAHSPKASRPVPLPSRLPDSASLCLGMCPSLAVCLVDHRAWASRWNNRRQCDLLLQLLELLERKSDVTLPPGLTEAQTHRLVSNRDRWGGRVGRGTWRSTCLERSRSAREPGGGLRPAPYIAALSVVLLHSPSGATVLQPDNSRSLGPEQWLMHDERK